MELEGPLKLGVWIVAFVYDGKRIATTEFFITPQFGDHHLQFGTIDNESHKAWEKYLPDDTKSVAARRTRASLLNNDTISFLDKMVAEFFAIQDICHIGHPPQSCAGSHIHDWQSCLITDWSSFSQDPKSNLP